MSKRECFDVEWVFVYLPKRRGTQLHTNLDLQLHACLQQGGEKHSFARATTSLLYIHPLLHSNLTAMSTVVGILGVGPYDCRGVGVDILRGTIIRSVHGTNKCLGLYLHTRIQVPFTLKSR